ncbi:MAG: hypothetical protein V2A66_06375, partial [Pseudomonadota bacterium]
GITGWLNCTAADYDLHAKAQGKLYESVESKCDILEDDQLLSPTLIVLYRFGQETSPADCAFIIFILFLHIFAANPFVFWRGPSSPISLFSTFGV